MRQSVCALAVLGLAGAAMGDISGINSMQFNDEGGVWLITNGTSFSGGAGQDFFLFGEGGFNNPAAPPIYGNNELVEMTYTYYAAGALGPGEHARFEATVHNVTRGVTVSS